MLEPRPRALVALRLRRHRRGLVQQTGSLLFETTGGSEGGCLRLRWTTGHLRPTGQPNRMLLPVLPAERAVAEGSNGHDPIPSGAVQAMVPCRNVSKEYPPRAFARRQRYGRALRTVGADGGRTETVGVGTSNHHPRWGHGFDRAMTDPRSRRFGRAVNSWRASEVVSWLPCGAALPATGRLGGCGRGCPRAALPRCRRGAGLNRAGEPRPSENTC
jgi:hypothetical protein